MVLKTFKKQKMETTKDFSEITSNLIQEIKILKNETESKQVELAKIMARNFLQKFKMDFPKNASYFFKLKIEEDEISESLINNNLGCLEYLILLDILNNNSHKPTFHEFQIQIPEKHRIKKISQKEINKMICDINSVTHGTLVIGIYGKFSYTSNLRFKGKNLTIRGCYKFN
jgi:hypothetical protein